MLRQIRETYQNKITKQQHIKQKQNNIKQTNTKYNNYKNKEQTLKKNDS